MKHTSIDLMEKEQLHIFSFYQPPVTVNSEVIDATSPFQFQEADLTALLNIQHALGPGTDLLSS